MARDVELDIIANDKTDRATRSAARNFDRLGRKADSVGSNLKKALPDNIIEVFSKSVSSALRSLPMEVQGAALIAAAAIGAIFSAALAAAITSGVLLAVGGGVLAGGIALAFKDPRVQEVLNGKTDTFTHGLQKKPKKGEAFQPRGSEHTVKASEGLLDKVKSVFGKAAEPFVQPLVNGLQGFSELLDRIAPQITALFATMAPAVKPLFDTFGSILEKALPGIQEAAEASLPLFEKLAEHAPEIGDAINDFFHYISNGAPGAIDFFGHFLTWLEDSIRVVGALIGGLTILYHWITELARGLKSFLVDALKVVDQTALAMFGTLINGAAEAFGWIPGVGPKLKEAAEKFNRFRDDVNNALNGIEDETVTVTVRVAGLAGLAADAAVGLVAHGLRARAAGGPVMAGNAYLVGEQGPEIVRFGQSGYVSSNPDSARMLSGPTEVHVYQHIDVTGGEQQFKTMVKKWFRNGEVPVPAKAVV